MGKYPQCYTYPGVQVEAESKEEALEKFKEMMHVDYVRELSEEECKKHHEIMTSMNINHEFRLWLYSIKEPMLKPYSKQFLSLLHDRGLEKVKEHAKEQIKYTPRKDVKKFYQDALNKIEEIECVHNI